MTNQPNSNLNDFESQLRQLSPGLSQKLADRTEETFYNAGWAAAEKHFQLKQQSATAAATAGPAATSRRAVTNPVLESRNWKELAATFTSGLAVGLILWIAATQSSDVESNVVTTHTGSTSADPSNRGIHFPSQQTQLETELPESIQDSALLPDADLALQSFLSRAGSLHWRAASASNQLSQITSQEINGSQTEEEVLKTSPLHRDEFADLL